jgi:nicotinamidase/pyrazinamidase
MVDIQNDFCPGGALPVPEGDAVVEVANRVQARFELVLATQDWHPRNHGSFAANHEGKRPGDVIDLDGIAQILWPVHCVQHTPGAALRADLDQSRVARVFSKGTNPLIDSYSAFFDNAHRQATGLGGYLSEQGVDEVWILGLATDYCVKFTALDAVQLGLKTRVIADGCRGVLLQPDDIEKAVAEMRAAGVEIVGSGEVG